MIVVSNRLINLSTTYQYDMAEINQCCDGMRTMKEQTSITPFTALGQESGQMYVRGRNNQVFDYNQVRNCPFCGRAIAIDR
jgi:hypothetical protein